MLKDFFRWCGGRQGTGYQKMLLFRSQWLKCDLWLLRSSVGVEVPDHCDAAPAGFAHWRMNVVLRQARRGGIFSGDDVRVNWPRLKVFRSDRPHRVTTIEEGRRLILSAGVLHRE